MPALYPVTPADLFDLRGHLSEVTGPIGEKWRVSHTAKLDNDALVSARKFADHSIPQPAICGHTMDEGNGVAFAARVRVHAVAPRRGISAGVIGLRCADQEALRLDMPHASARGLRPAIVVNSKLFKHSY
jgi:hypothetical protein